MGSKWLAMRVLCKGQQIHKHPGCWTALFCVTLQIFKIRKLTTDIVDIPLSFAIAKNTLFLLQKVPKYSE